MFGKVLRFFLNNETDLEWGIFKRREFQILVVTRHQYGISVLVPQTEKPKVTSRNVSCFVSPRLHESAQIFARICLSFTRDPRKSIYSCKQYKNL